MKQGLPLRVLGGVEGGDSQVMGATDDAQRLRVFRGPGHRTMRISLPRPISETVSEPRLRVFMIQFSVLQRSIEASSTLEIGAHDPHCCVRRSALGDLVFLGEG